jgi:alpha-amylase
VQHSGTSYTVGSDSKLTATIGSNDAVALYAGATCNSSGSGTSASGASFAVNATTVLGQNIYVAGNNNTLGNWDTGKALLLSSAAYPVWKLDVPMGAGTAFEYKYIKKDGSGNVTWETGSNRTATVPSSGKVTVSDTWRS